MSIDPQAKPSVSEEQLELIPHVTVTSFDNLPDADKQRWKMGVINGELLPRQEMNTYLRKLLESRDELVAFSSLSQRESLMARIMRRIAIGISTLLVIAIFTFVVETIALNSAYNLSEFIPLAILVSILIAIINFGPQLLGKLADWISGWRLFSGYSHWAVPSDRKQDKDRSITK